MVADPTGRKGWGRGGEGRGTVTDRLLMQAREHRITDLRSLDEGLLPGTPKAVTSCTISGVTNTALQFVRNR